MSENRQVCVIYKEGGTLTKRPMNDPSTIIDFLKCCLERVSLGQSELQKQTDYLTILHDLELQSVYFHSECHKPIVNKGMVERLRGKRSKPDSPVPSSSRKPGHPLSAKGPIRPKRSKTQLKEEVCLF